MNNNEKVDEVDFEILGFKLKFSPEARQAQGEYDSVVIDPQVVVNHVKEECLALRKKAPKLSDGHVAILVALKMGLDKMTLEQEYRESLGKLQTSAMDALQYLEEVSPSSLPN